MSYTDLLKARTGDIVKPKPIPVGSYHATVSKAEPCKSEKKGTEGVAFTFRLNAPGEDIDPDLVAEHAERIAKATPIERYWLTPDSLWRLRDFLLVTLAIPDENQSLEELIAQSTDRPCIVLMKHIQNQSGDDFIAVVDKTLPAAE